MSVSEVQSRMSSPEFVEWIAFYQLEAELSGGASAESSEEAKVDQLRAFAAAHNARLPATGSR